MEAGFGIGRLDVDDVVGPYPCGRADRKTSLGAGGQLTCGLDVAPGEGGLRRSQVGIGQITLASVSHGELRIGVGGLRLAHNCGAKHGDGFFRKFRIAGGIERLCQQDLNQGIVMRQLDGVPQRSDGFRRMPAFQQRLTLQFVEIWIVRLGLNE